MIFRPNSAALLDLRASEVEEPRGRKENDTHASVVIKKPFLTQNSAFLWGKISFEVVPLMKIDLKNDDLSGLL